MRRPARPSVVDYAQAGSAGRCISILIRTERQNPRELVRARPGHGLLFDRIFFGERVPASLGHAGLLNDRIVLGERVPTSLEHAGLLSGGVFFSEPVPTWLENAGLFSGRIFFSEPVPTSPENAGLFSGRIFFGEPVPTSPENALRPYFGNADPALRNSSPG